MRSMLSFDNGIPVAHALNKRGKKILTIFVTPEKEDPDIETDNIDELIEEGDFDDIKNSLKLNNTEIRLIKKVLSTGRSEDRSGGSKEDILSERLKLALDSLRKNATRKLKTELKFTKSDEIYRIVPLIGGKDVPFDRSIFLTGPSGSGKSFLAKEIMKHDEKNRPIIVFSKIEDDESLRELKKLKVTKSSFPDQRDGGSRMIRINLQTEDDLLNLPSNHELKNCVCLFDDIDAFPKEIAEFLNEYRDSILECGRHHNITVLSTSHQLYNWSKTRVILNESELVCLFPHANKRSSMTFLRDRMGLGAKQINRIVNEAMNSGRCLICKMSAPNIIMHEKGIIIV